MYVSLSFSGGASHASEISPEKKVELAEKIATLVKSALETNCIGGNGAVTVDDRSATISATTSYSL